MRKRSSRKSLQKSYELIVYAKQEASRAKTFMDFSLQYSGQFEYNQDKSPYF